MGAAASVLANPNEKNGLMIQYLGNDIRSHLKVTLCGLQIMEETANKNQDLKSLEIIRESTKPCLKAMKQLNDMLLMEMINSNTLVLESHNITVRTFLMDIIHKYDEVRITSSFYPLCI